MKQKKFNIVSKTLLTYQNTAATKALNRPDTEPPTEPTTVTITLTKTGIFNADVKN